MSEIAFKSACELVRDIKGKKISSEELTEHYIQRIEHLDERTNAVVVRDFESALETAKAADVALARGDDLGPLHGLPITVKEAYDVADTATTWGIPELAQNIVSKDSDVVNRLKRAGAHLLGQTNVPIYLSDYQSFNDIYGVTRNPWDLERSPGGSSGGSAAALAAGFTGLEMGSDLAGSVRNPAHFCGVYGHKSTWGVIPNEGHNLPGIESTPDMSVLGPLARTAEDLELALNVVSGVDSDHKAGWQLNLPKPTKQHLREFRVAIWPDHNLAPVDVEISDRVEEIGQLLRRLGSTVSVTALPDIDFARSFEIYISLFQGVVSNGSPEAQLAHTRSQVELLEANDNGMLALMQRGLVQDHATWHANSEARLLLRRAWKAFFGEWDILICPQMATTAFFHDHSDLNHRMLTVNGQPQHFFQQMFWSATTTVANLPSTVFPTGLSKSGLPIGIQAVGAEFSDYQTIDFARLMANEVGGYLVPPGFE